MPTFRTGRVTAIISERPGLQRVEVDGEPAFALVQLTGDVALGDEVVVNTTAVELGLGTGGWHVVHWNLSRREWREPGPGHVMKLRYTSLQADTGAFDERGAVPATLDGMPVVACSVHSQLAPVVVAARAERAPLRIAYVMTDGGALPLALSDLVAAMRDAGLVDATVTAGHAFGGDLEAVNVGSALTAARHVAHADMAVVGPGPGLVGTGTELGTTALDVVSTLDHAAALGGRPVLAVRMSSADGRDRHRGLSHHARTALELVARRDQVVVPVPSGEHISDDLGLGRTTSIDPPDIGRLLANAGIEVTHLGRSPLDDPLFFAAAAVGGVAAARLVD
jgi:hypothetical protein